MRVLIYTAITGGKDSLHRPEITPGADYLCFTDQPGACKGKGWDVQRIDSPYGNTRDGFCRAAKRPKIRPHKWLPAGYDFSVWVDASRHPSKDLTPLIGVSDKFGLFWHPKKQSGRTVEREAQVCTEIRADDPDVIARHMARYDPETLQLPVYMCGYLFRAHNDPEIIALMESWWSEIKNGSRRDQLSLPHVTHRAGFTPKMLPRGDHTRYFATNGHKR